MNPLVQQTLNKPDRMTLPEIEFDGIGVYNGEWKNGKKEGQGVLNLVNGEKYTGEFKEDEFDGQGMMHFSNGKKMGGIWKKGDLIEKKEECKIF